MAKVSPYHHGELRDAVMAAALKVIAEDGVSALSLRQLAREAGVSHGAPAHHFGDRKGLFTALAIAGCELLIEGLNEALATSPKDPKGRLRAVGIAYVQFALDNPAYFEVMFNPELLRRDDVRLETIFRQARQMLEDALAEFDDTGNARHRDVAALRAWSLAHGLASLLLSGNVPSIGSRREAAELGALIFD